MTPYACRFNKKSEKEKRSVNTMAKSRLLPLMAWVLVLSLVLIGCNTTVAPTAAPTPSPTEAPTQTSTPTVAPTATPVPTPTPIDTSKQVNLVFYQVGDPQPDETTFENDLNKMLLKDINATVQFKYLSWGDVYDKYPLIMASGEVFDGTYATNWLDFFGNAQKGAFLDITDMLKTYCPDILAQADKDSWKAVTYKGRIYGIPRDGGTDYVIDGIIYREDLREKYNVPEIKSIDDFETYMLAIKQNEPGMKPCSLDNVDGQYFFDYGLFEKSGFEFANTDYYGLAYQRDDPMATMFVMCDTPQFKDMVNLMVKWREEGLWSASDMANANYTNDPDQSELGQGVSAIWGVTAGHWYSTIEYLKTAHPDWKTGFYYGPSPSGHVDKEDALEDGAAISTTSKNPERALMALNLMIANKDYKIMLNYGVQDKNFVLDSNGTPQYPNGETQETASFQFGENSFGWLAYGSDPFPSPRNEASDVIDHMKTIANAQTLLSFYFDTSSVKTEVAALDDVITQYEVPLEWGLVKKSVDDDIATLKVQLEAAGIEKVREEMQKQINQYLADNAK